jgi:hypothetical protein
MLPAREGRKNVSHTSGNILLHLIFSTSQRRPLIKPEFRDDLFAYLGGIIREMNGIALINCERHGGPRSYAGTGAAIAIGSGDRASGENKFVEVGTREMES